MKRDEITKYIVGGVLALVFFGSTVWLVKSEGEKTREALRGSGKDVAEGVKEGLIEGAEAAVEKVSEMPGEVIRDVKDELSGTVVEEAKEMAKDAVEMGGDLLGELKDVVSDEVDEEPEGKKSVQHDADGSHQIGDISDTSTMPHIVRDTVDQAGKVTGEMLDRVTNEMKDGLPEAAKDTVDEVGKLSGKVLEDMKEVVLPGQDKLRGGTPLPVPVQLIPNIQPTVAPPPIHPGYHGPSTVYHHSATAQEARMRGMGDLVRADSEARLNNSAAAVNYTMAQRNQIGNRVAATHAYFRLRQANRVYRAAERHPPPTMGQLVRYAQAGKPKRLSPSELNPVSGKINWPMVLQHEMYAADRSLLDAAFVRRAAQSTFSTDDYFMVKNTTDRMLSRLSGQIREVPQNRYMIAKRFLESLSYEAEMPSA